MLEKRAARRRRVCLEGYVSSGHSAPALVVRVRVRDPRSMCGKLANALALVVRVRVRDIGAHGAQIVTDADIGDRLDFGLARADGCRPADVVWRSGGRVGLRFADRGEVQGALAAWRERLAEIARCARAPGETEPVSSSRP